jgi:predicted nucleic acid-binding protein
MICVDASVAIKWIVLEEWTVNARALYFDALDRGEVIAAPPLMPIEVTNTLLQRTRGPGAYSLQQAELLLSDFLSSRFTIFDLAGMHQRALVLADTFRLPAAYDAHYLALSEMLECDFWTADLRLIDQVEKGLPFVRWIGDFETP